MCCRALPAGIHTFSPDLSDDRPLFMVSYLAMELLGPTCWEAVNAMHAQQDAIVGSSAGWSDDELDMPLRMPSTEWIVKTGQGMLKVRPLAFQWQHCRSGFCMLCVCVAGSPAFAALPAHLTAYVLSCLPGG